MIVNRCSARGTSLLRRWLQGQVLLAAAAVSLAACDSLLEVKIPGRVEEGALDDPRLSRTLLVSALGEFECAFSQMVPTTGLLAGEYITSGSFVGLNTWGWRGEVEIKATEGSCPDARNAANYGYYTPLQRARFLAEDAFRRIEAFPDAEVPGKATMLVQLSAYAAYTYVLLGEGFCEMAIDQGPIVTRQEVFALAEQAFTRTLGLDPDADLRNMALVGRARARLNLGKLQEAAADAEQVPFTYVKNVAHSTVTPRRENRVYNLNIANRFSAVGSSYRGLTIQGQPDTRVRVAAANRNGQDGVTPQWDQLKFASPSAPIRLASGVEAKLILAEARGGQPAIDALNEIRALSSLPPLDAAESANLLATVIEERRRELFSEGHRHGDMIRYNVPFPTGVNHKGQTYGSVTCIPLPDVETLNNPNINR